MSGSQGSVLIVEVGGALIGTFLGGVLADGLLLVTIGGTFPDGVLAEGLLLASVGDTFLGGVLSDSLLLGIAVGIFLVVKVLLMSTHVTKLLLSSSSPSLSSLSESTSTRSDI